LQASPKPLPAGKELWPRKPDKPRKKWGPRAKQRATLRRSTIDEAVDDPLESQKAIPDAQTKAQELELQEKYYNNKKSEYVPMVPDACNVTFRHK